MRRGIVLLLMLVLAGLAAAPRVAEAAAPVAVVELFTSEGCSSCPPADALLARVVADARVDGQRVEALAWHVGYWNRLGWRDRFSLPEAAARQRQLAAARGEGGAFTPEAVVNGRTSLVGSDAPHLRAALAAALARPLPAALAVTARRDAATGSAVVTLSGGPLPAGAEVLVAVVEDGLSTRVARGENAHRTLHHARVVRAVAHVAANALTAPLILPLPGDLVPAHARVVVLAEEAGSRRLLAAAGTQLEGAVKNTK